MLVVNQQLMHFMNQILGSIQLLSYLQQKIEMLNVKQTNFTLLILIYEDVLIFIFYLIDEL